VVSEYLTRAVVFNLDLSSAQERLLTSYAGSRRRAYNWVLDEVRANLMTRASERAAGVAEADHTPSLSWSAYSLNKAFNAAKVEVAPWWREVSMHAFRSGIADAAAALKNFSDSKKGIRTGRRVSFPTIKTRNRSVPSVSFVEINHQLSWLHPDRHHLRLMLPRSSPDADVRRRTQNLTWIHTTESTRRLFTLVEAGRARIQKVTISKRGGRWQVAFCVRYPVGLPARRQVARAKRHRGIVGLDAGLAHLATLDRVIPGLTDQEGHVANPRILGGQLSKLAKLDRALARTEKHSKNRTKLRRRRARMHGRIAKTRALCLHRLTNALIDGFDAVAIEDLNLAGMGRRKGRLGRSVADASLGELRRQLTYKSADRGTTLVKVDRFYPSSKTCSCCGAVRAKLPRSARVFACESCGVSLDRDVNAARNIAREGTRLLSGQPETEHDVAGLRPETQNADPRSRQTGRAQALSAAAA
jgi:putative transposase